MKNKVYQRTISVFTRVLTCRNMLSHLQQIPYYTDRIMQEAVSKGKRVLITSHENAIRGILMHLCSIPEEAMNQLHLPNGVPLVYNVKGKCITLLDDGSGEDPMQVYDFGPAAKYLFKPCELTDDFFEEVSRNSLLCGLFNRIILLCVL